MAEYDKYTTIVLELDKQVPNFLKLVQKNMKDEELLFSYRLKGFENWEKAYFKITKFTIFWKNAFAFYEHKKQVVNNFTMDIDIQFSLYTIEEFENKIRENKKGLSKTEEVIIKLSKSIEDDINNFREFLRVAKMIVEADEMYEDLERSLADIEDNKKTDPAFKQTLRIILANKKLISS